MFETRDQTPGHGHGPCPDAPPAGAAERREGERHIAVMRVAKLHTSLGEELCLVRNISPGGLMAHIWSQIVMHDTLVAEFKSGHAVPGKVVWRRENRIGVEFDDVIDIVAVLAGDEDPVPGLPPRAPRVTVSVKGRLRCGAHYFPIVVSNVSQGGIRIDYSEPAVDDRIGDGPVVLNVPGLPPLAGVARWHGDGRAGIAFNAAVPLDTIARWIADNQQG